VSDCERGRTCREFVKGIMTLTAMVRSTTRNEPQIPRIAEDMMDIVDTHRKKSDRDTERNISHKKTPLKELHANPTLCLRRSRERAHADRKMRREDALRKKRSVRKVRFDDDVKTHDGLSPLSLVVDTVVWEYFSGKIKSVPDVVNALEPKHLHLLSDAHKVLTKLIHRIKSEPGVNIHVLPFGGGHSSMVSFPTHYPSLRYLREIVRKTHNRLHVAAVAAVAQKKTSHDATKFVLEHMKWQEEQFQRTKASKPLLRRELSCHS